MTTCDKCADMFFVMKKRMKLKEFAAVNNISYRTALRHWQAGLIEGVQNGSGAILVSEYVNGSNYETPSVVKAVVFVRSADDRLAGGREKKLDLFVKGKGVDDYDTIFWDGFIFQANPFLEKILDEGYNHVFVETLTDLFGVNYKVLNRLFAEQGVKVEALSEPVAVAAVVYEFYLAAVNMAKAAVGMTGYKKRLFDSANKIFS